jgi:DNA polymerase-3 subunit alpha
MSGLAAQKILKNDMAGAKKAAQTFVDIFGDRFYVEIMRHGIPEQDAVNAGLITLAREMNLPLVATNDSHYLNRNDASWHDVLLCIGTGKTLGDMNRLKFGSDEFYVKSNLEMRELFADVPDAVENTLAIAKRIDIQIPEKQFNIPLYPVPQASNGHTNGQLALVGPPEKSADEYLRERCEIGLVERYGAERAASDAALRERLDYELDVITKMGFASYFLIVWDFIKYARDNDIPVGPGRGSAVGSLVSYVLRITDLDPIKFNLIFERFLNPARISMPDIDTDFCVERRDEVIAYVTDKYGKDHVAQIVTFGTMAARAAIRDAGRALGVPLPEVDRVAKLIPSGPNGLSVEQALKSIPELKNLADNSPSVRQLLDTASSIEGLARHASTHAAGVVISKAPLVDVAPLITLGEGDVNTQYDMIWVERIGLLKMDFLGLRNLTVMKKAVDEIRRLENPTFDLAAIPDDDPATFAMLERGDTTGVFQLESDGMRRVAQELKPSVLADIIALVALYRPGPMELIPQYISNKHGRTTTKYLHPKLEPILAETYGIACLRAGTPVWYADGTVKAIEEVQAGDEILTYDRGEVRPAKAARVWASGKKQLLRIKLSSGTVIECSEDHRFPTPAGDLPASALRPNHSYAKLGHYMYSQPESMMFEAWQKPRADAAPFSIGEDRAYLLGMFVGDGTLKCNGSKYITCATEADARWLAARLELAFSCQTRVHFNTRAWYVRPVFYTTPRPTALTLWLDEIYEGRSWKEHCAKKRLPDRYLDLPERERVALLRGLWDSDGTYAGTGQYFRSTSPELISQVRHLLSSLKIAYYVRPTAVFVQDRTRFSTLVGTPALPSKQVKRRLERNAVAIPTARLRARLQGSLTLADSTSRKCFQRASRFAMTKVLPASSYLQRIPGFWDAYRKTYSEAYLGDTRPVFIDSIERVEIDDCYDLQMDDQSSPYFIANGVATHNCYQEQVMQIARDIAGFSMSEADELRKVMGKKQKDKIPVYRKKFVDGAVEQGLTAKLADDIFAFVEPFAGYGFNKSHAAAYGWIAYQTAFLKANYPHAYLAALMTSVGDKTDKLVEYIEEARKIGISVLPPDVNTSLESFTVVDREIRFGLAAIKGVGEGAVKAIIAAREAGGPFTDLFDLTGRVDSRQANRKVYEALIKSGALDSLGSNRAELLDAVDDAFEISARVARERELGQTSLFGGASEENVQALAPRMRKLAPPPMLEQLAWEKETLGIFVSGHPLAGVAEALKRTGAVEIRALRGMPEDEFITIAGLVVDVRRTLTKAQQQILYATVEDQSGAVEAIVFPKSYAQLQGPFQKDAIVVVKGRLRFRSGKASDESGDAAPSLHVSEVAPFERPPERGIDLGWHVEVQDRSQIDALAKLAHRWAGEVPVVVHVGGRAQRMRGGIAESPLVKRELETIFARVWQEPA